MKDIENILQTAGNAEIKIPNKIENNINYTLNNIEKFHNKSPILKKLQFKLIPTLVFGIISFAGVCFASSYVIKNYFAKNEGLSTAIDNDYVINNASEYVESNGIKIKIEQLVLDDYNLEIICNIKLDENNYYLENLYKFRFKDILVMDENKNVLYAEYENQEDFYKYCKENNLDKGTYGTGFSNGSYTGKILNKNDNNLNFSFYTTADKFPNSKNLYIKFNTIYLYYQDSSLNKSLKGTWNLTVDLEKLQEERDTIEYLVENINDDKTVVTKASLTMANMKIELITDSDKIDFKKLQNRELGKTNVSDLIPFYETYLETEDGKKFFLTTTGENGYETLEDGKIRYYATYNYTYFNKSERVKIVLPTNNNNEIIIELKSKS